MWFTKGIERLRGGDIDPHPASVRRMWEKIDQLEAAVERLKTENQALEKNNRELRNEICSLKRDPNIVRASRE